MKAKIDVGANREYKDTVFTLLFGTKEAAVQVSNTVFGTNYGPDTVVEFTTLKNVLSKGRLNDLSFVLDGKLVVLIEHQSTINENMPLRMLIYIAVVYELLLKDKNLYSRKRFTIPEPKFIVFHIGDGDMPEDKRELRLSDMFAKHGIKAGGLGGLADLELVVTVYNINKGHNLEMMRNCPTLDGYGSFVFMIRENQKTMSLEKAIKKAVLDCIDQNILREFLSHRKMEVMGMLLQEWKLEDAVVVAKEEAAEDRAIKIARNLRAKGMGVDDVAEATGLTVDDVLKL